MADRDDTPVDPLAASLTAVLTTMADEAPGRTDRAATVRAAARRGRWRATSLAAAAAVVLAAGGTAVLQSGGRTTTVASSACTGSVTSTVIPDWARTGFSDPEPVAPYATGHAGRVVAILFGPLYAPPVEGYGNKILWVARDGGTGPLRIEAHLEGTDVVERVVLPDGAGPSGVDLPRAGCWRLDLVWATGSDTVDLRYETPPPGATAP